MALRRLSGFILFLSTLSVVLGVGHYYVARRMVLDTGLPSPWREGALALLVLLPVLLLAYLITFRRASGGWVRYVAVLVYGWCGVWFMLVAWLGISDGLLWLFSDPLAMALQAGGDGVTALPRYRAVAVGALVAGLSVVAVNNAMQAPKLEPVTIRLDTWPRELDGFRIVQISDLHIGPVLGRAFTERVVAQVNNARPDLIVITGDLADGDPARLADQVAPLEQLDAPHGVYFVTGNHDYYSDDVRWCAALQRMGITPLRNARTRIGAAPHCFELAGVDDHNGVLAGGDREAHERALAGRDAALPVILLAHDPVSTPLAVEHGVDLQLSGHTHGGQLWPFRYLVRLTTPFVAGLYRRQKTQIYVNRGTGFWGPPMRLGAPAEVSVIHLRAPV